MISWALHLLACGSAAGVQSSAPDLPPLELVNLRAETALAPQYLNNNRVMLGFASDTTEHIHRVEPLVSTDGRGIWMPADAKRVGEHTLRFDAPHDGRYDFFIVIETAGGRSADPPASGAAPHATIVVDTTVPILQIHRLTAASPPGGDRLLHLEL